ncbi:MAG TPA: nucleotidyltransferase family protein, partial [Thermoanaerobaculia bacterium]|nr:nucleotidyltransferase family protein [Thermoanaerobaculia bacterium]
TADAVLAAEGFAGEEDFLVVNSDNLYPSDALAGLAALSGPGVALFFREALLSKSNIPPGRIAAFAVCVVAPDGTLDSIIEKPDAATLARLGPDAPVSMNCWRFSPEIFDACRNVPVSPRGELELPTAVHEAIRSGVHFRVVRSGDGVLDLSQRSDIAAVGEHLRNLPATP